MNWHQPISIERASFSISHQDKVCAIGSCFAENVGVLMRKSGFQTAINPNGIVFNPLSLAFAMDGVLNGTPPTLIQNKETWYSLDHHGAYKSRNKKELKLRIAHERADFLTHLKESKVLFVTFGTAQVWENIELDRVVANCHKLPSQDFESRLLALGEIVDSWKKVITGLRELNKDLQLVFTVSPVRYRRGGAHQNSLSKSILHLAIQALTEDTRGIAYFPAYEICIDELRDYRFFDEDKIHPSKEAVQYVYSKLQEAYMTEESIDLARKIANLNKRLDHRYSDPLEAEQIQAAVKSEIKELLG